MLSQLITRIVNRASLETFSLGFFLACLAGVYGPAFALDLKLQDRLSLPAQHYLPAQHDGHFERTAFLAIERMGERLISVGERGVIVYSDDQGASWKQAQVPVSTLITSIDAVNANQAWAVGHSGSILYSADAGANWQLQLDGRQANALLLAHAQAKVETLKTELAQADEADQEDLQFSLEDAEFALSNAQFDLDLGPANPFLDVLFLNEKQGYAVGAYGLFVKTLDGGATWQTVAHLLENFDRYHLNVISQLADDTLIIAGEAGTLFASYDRGETWETLYGPYQGSFFGMQANGAENEVLLYGLKGNIFKTLDGGQSWERIDVDVETSLTASAMSASGRLAIVGLSGVILLSDDKGAHFSKVKTEGFEGFNGVEFVSNSQLVLVSDEGIQLLSID